MSPQVDNFVHSLVEMAKAQEMLPTVQERVRELEAHLDHANETIQARELSIIDYKREIEQLHSRIREVEVARDQAETMFLECDDKLQRVARSFQVALEAMDSTDRVITAATERPAPEVAVSSTEQVQGVSGASPTSATVQSTDGGNVGSVNSSENAGQGQSESSPSVVVEQSASSVQSTEAVSSEGQSEPDPILGSDTAHTEQAASVPTVVSSTDAPTQSEPSTVRAVSGPYTGKRYYDHPAYVTKADWLAGGGSQADYDWRPHAYHGGAAGQF